MVCIIIEGIYLALIIATLSTSIYYITIDYVNMINYPPLCCSR